MKTTKFWLFVATALVASATMVGCGKDDDGDGNGDGNGNGNGNGDGNGDGNTEITVPASVQLPVGPGTVTFAVTAPANEDWTIGSAPSWVTVTPRGGTGNGTVTVVTNGIHISLHAREATLTVGGNNVKLTQPGYIMEFPDLLHPENEGQYLLLASTNFSTGDGTTYNFAASPDDPGDYFQYGVGKGYTAESEWDTSGVADLRWQWCLKYSESNFPPSAYKDDGYEAIFAPATAEEFGRFGGSSGNPTGQQYRTGDFDETPYQWRAANEVGNKVAGLFVGENAEEATIADLKGTTFFPAAGYRDATNNGALTEYGEKGYYICWQYSGAEPRGYMGVFVVSEDGWDVWVHGSVSYEENGWNLRNGASLRMSFNNEAMKLD
jgi:hypothetical protein